MIKSQFGFVAVAAKGPTLRQIDATNGFSGKPAVANRSNIGHAAGMGRALSSIVGKVIGADAGIMVAAVTQIEQTGLTLEQIKNIGDGLLSYIKDVDPAPRSLQPPPAVLSGHDEDDPP